MNLKEVSMNLKKALIFLSTFLILNAPVFAEEAKTGEEKPKKAWSDEAEVSFVSTSGNTETTTLSGKNTFKYRFPNNYMVQWYLSALYGENSDEKTAERYITDLKLHYMFTDRFFSGLGIGWMKDEFAGFKNKYYLGPYVGYHFLTGPKHFFSSGIMLNYAREDYVNNTDKDFLEGKSLSLYRYVFNEKTAFSQKIEYLHDFDDSKNYKFISLSALTFAITEIISLKTSYEIRYVNHPVPRTLDSTDKTLMMSLVFNM